MKIVKEEIRRGCHRMLVTGWQEKYILNDDLLEYLWGGSGAASMEDFRFSLLKFF